MAVIVILGMHRSGTSMLARTLARLGATPGAAALTAPAADNALGFWEHPGIIAVQQGLLDALGRPHLHAQAAQPLPDGWLESEAAGAAEAALTALLAAELAARANPQQPFLVKDPRTPALLPLWHRVLAGLGEEARYLVCLRHPVAVAASLHARNVAAPALGEALWLRHHLDILRHAGPHIAAVADYDRVLDAPLAELTRIAAALGLPAPDAEAAADLARPGLRHQHPATAPLFPLAGALYQALRDGTPPPSAAGFEAAMALFAATPGWLEQALAFGTSHALPFPSVQQGNPWCEALEEGFQLHPNPPEAAPPRLDWPALPLRGRHAWFHARVTTQADAWPMLLDVWLHREGRALAGEEVPLPPGRSGPVRVDFPDVGPGEVTLSLALRLHADALDNTNGVVTLFRPSLETS